MNQKNTRYLIKAILNNDISRDLKKEINKLHPAEISELIEQLPKEKREPLWKIIPPQLKGEIFLEVHGEVKKYLIKITPESELIKAISNLQLDEIADLDEDLPIKVVNAVIKQMDSRKKEGYESIKTYPHNTAGGLMDLDTISIRPDITISVALRFIRYLRNKYKLLPEHFDSIYIVDNSNKFIGTVSLVELVSLSPDIYINKIVNKKTQALIDTLPSNKVAKIFEDQDLISAPVVDSVNRLLGRITVDDIVDIIRHEGEKLTMRPVGLSEKTDIFDSINRTIKLRSLWYSINLINAFIAALTISFFSDSIDQIVSLAILMPIIASMSGVAGNQTLTLVIRGLALEQITPENQKILFKKELLVGFLNGLIWAFIVIIITYSWMRNFPLSLVFGVSLLLSLFLSTTAGTVIPFFLKKLKIDPALAGSVIMVAISDVAGFFIFLSIATFFLIN